MLYMGAGPRASNGTYSTVCRISVTSSATHKHIGPFWCCFPSGWVCVHSRPLWVSPTNSPVKLGVSPAAAATPHRCFQSEVLRLYLPALKLWVPRSASLPTCSSPFTCTRMWDCPLHQPPPCGVRQPQPCCNSSPPSCPSPPLLPVWMNVPSLFPWLSDFHTVGFSVSSGYFLFLNCCCPSLGCGRGHSVSTYASILAGSCICIFVFFFFLNIFIDCAITVVPFPPPLHSILPSPSLPHSPPIVHVHGSYL